MKIPVIKNLKDLRKSQEQGLIRGSPLALQNGGADEKEVKKLIEKSKLSKKVFSASQRGVFLSEHIVYGAPAIIMIEAYNGATCRSIYNITDEGIFYLLSCGGKPEHDQRMYESCFS